MIQAQCAHWRAAAGNDIGEMCEQQDGQLDRTCCLRFLQLRSLERRL